MKLLSSSGIRRRGQNGSAVAVVLAMLGIMMICLAANTVAVRTLGRELKLLDKKQVQHWQNTSAKTTGVNLSPTNLQAEATHAHE